MTNEELRAIDVRIDREVMGQGEPKYHEYFEQYLRPGEGSAQSRFVPQYSQSDADALAALDRLCADHKLRYSIDGGTALRYQWTHENVPSTTSMLEHLPSSADDWQCICGPISAATRPLAICLAIVDYLDWRKTHDA